MLTIQTVTMKTMEVLCLNFTIETGVTILGQKTLHYMLCLPLHRLKKSIRLTNSKAYHIILNALAKDEHLGIHEARVVTQRQRYLYHQYCLIYPLQRMGCLNHHPIKMNG